MIKTPLSTVIGGAFWTPNCTILGSASKTLNQIIKSLFANNEQGFVYDPNDLTTMFQDAAGTVPVTSVGQPVGLMLDKSKGVVRAELITNGTFDINTNGWTSVNATLSATSGKLQIISTTSPTYAYTTINTVVGRRYILKFDLTRGTTPNNNQWRVGTTVGNPDVASGNVGLSGSRAVTFTATTTTTYISFGFGEAASGQTSYWDNISILDIAGNHAYQTTSSMRPLLVASPQRLDFDTADDKLITNLPAQLTGCTVVHSAPNVGTQILTGQTIPATYEDNKDHCGLIVINRALTATETSQITKLFNKAAGV